MAQVMNGCYLQGCQKPQIQDRVRDLANDLQAVADDTDPHTRQRILDTMASHGLLKER